MSEKAGGRNGKGVYHAQGDKLAVKTDDLAVVLERWIEKHDAEHPKEEGGRLSQARYGGARTAAIPPFSGREYIAFHSGRNQRTLYTVLKRRTEMTSLNVADDMLTAINEGDALTDGRVEIYRRSPTGLVRLNPGGLVSTEAGSI